MSWQAIIQRAAYTRFCCTGSLDPFHLKWPELAQLASELGGPSVATLLKLRENNGPDVVQMRLSVPVPTVGAGVFVMVDEWIP